MRKIALIGCSSKKVKGSIDDHDKIYEAQALYDGDTFKIAVDEECWKEKFGCENFHILSAKYHLLDKNTLISWYNYKLDNRYVKNYEENEKGDRVESNKEWAEKVIEQLQNEKHRYDLERDKFYIFAGQNYYENLKTHLKNCVTFDYYKGYVINLKSKHEQNNGCK